MVTVLPDELDVGMVLQEAEVSPSLDHLVHLEVSLPALDGVISAVGAGGQQVLGQGVVMLQEEPYPVCVHPPVPDVDIQAAHRLPEVGEYGVGEVRGVESGDGAPGVDHEQREAVPDGVRDGEVVLVGGEGVESYQQCVRLLQVSDLTLNSEK